MDELKDEEGKQQFEKARSKDHLRMQPTLKHFFTTFSKLVKSNEKQLFQEKGRGS